MKKIKDTIAAILYRLVTVAAKLLPATKGTAHLLIIKTDEIGDYILFRNMLRYFRQSDKYRHHKITLVGNSAWKTIFEEYDRDTVDDVIWLTKKQLNRDLGYRFSLLKQIRQLGASDVVNCIFSRSFLLDDGFAWVATGSSKIAMRSDNVNRGKNGVNIDGWIYTTVHNAGDETIFDAIRNSNFLSFVLGGTHVPISSRIPVKGRYEALAGVDYMLIFIGAGNPERKWPMANFVACAEYAASKYGLATVVCGGPPDSADAGELMQAIRGKAYNYAGKTSLIEYLQIAAGAKFAISVDTGPLHMAVAAGNPMIGLYSGKFYRRYAPYPKDMVSYFKAVYPDFVDKLIAEDNRILYDTFTMDNGTIKQITAEKVLAVVDEVMGR
jgi:ADP-heptose:LPS heptosyltransferase